MNSTPQPTGFLVNFKDGREFGAKKLKDRLLERGVGVMNGARPFKAERLMALNAAFDLGMLVNGKPLEIDGAFIEELTTLYENSATFTKAKLAATVKFDGQIHTAAYHFIQLYMEDYKKSNCEAREAAITDAMNPPSPSLPGASATHDAPAGADFQESPQPFIQAILSDFPKEAEDLQQPPGTEQPFDRMTQHLQQFSRGMDGEIRHLKDQERRLKAALASHSRISKALTLKNEAIKAEHLAATQESSALGCKYDELQARHQSQNEAFAALQLAHDALRADNLSTSRDLAAMELQYKKLMEDHHAEVEALEILRRDCVHSSAEKRAAQEEIKKLDAANRWLRETKEKLEFKLAKAHEGISHVDSILKNQ